MMIVLVSTQVYNVGSGMVDSTAYCFESGDRVILGGLKLIAFGPFTASS